MEQVLDQVLQSELLQVLGQVLRQVLFQELRQVLEEVLPKGLLPDDGPVAKPPVDTRPINLSNSDEKLVTAGAMSPLFTPGTPVHASLSRRNDSHD